jgi:hypothetical protein
VRRVRSSGERARMSTEFRTGTSQRRTSWPSRRRTHTQAASEPELRHRPDESYPAWVERLKATRVAPDNPQLAKDLARYLEHARALAGYGDN